MVAQRFTIYGENLTVPVIQFIREFHKEAYESEYPGGLLRVYEDFSVLNGNQLMVCIRLDLSAATTGSVMLELIAGGASGSIFFGEWMGSENRRIRDFRQELKSFCKNMKYRYAELGPS
ncbi:MAG: hypothetical protein NTW29_02870 [Bacteroidetes bacterium]|nr:hypothetical protein [Bacteroidota bacterium]